MEFVVDTNILYTFFWKDSITRKFLLKRDIKFNSPEFALQEINKHKSDIIKKTKISEKEFDITRKDIAIAVEFIPLEEYKEYLSKALLISPDPNDIDFIALSLKLNIPLWSNDKDLKNQKNIIILNTKEFIDNIKSKL